MDWFRTMVAPEKQVIVTAESRVGTGKVEGNFPQPGNLSHLMCKIKLRATPHN